MAADSNKRDKDDTNSGEDTTAVLQGDPKTLIDQMKESEKKPACLIIIRGENQGSVIPLTKIDTILGRETNQGGTADVSIRDQGISRQHVKVTVSPEAAYLTDMNSSNGTWINNNKMPPNSPQKLAKEDMIKLGSTILKFLPAGHYEAAMVGKLYEQANSDRLTKIYNKGFLLEALQAEFKRAKALHTPLSLIFFDLDHFKKVNDTFGHDAGDFVLQTIASMIKASFIKDKEIFARYGGEEFVVLLPNVEIDAAVERAEQIRKRVETNAFIFQGQKLPVTTSLGVTEMRTDTASSEALIKAADELLYKAKKEGRNRVVS